MDAIDANLALTIPSGNEIDVNSVLPVLAVDAAAVSPALPVASTDAVDFWVISTRRCPQTGFCLSAPEQYEYFHRDNGDCHWDNSDLSEFLASVTPTQPVCFFTHGNLVTWREAFTEGSQAARVIRATLPPGHRLTFVLITWPSDRVRPLPTADIEVKRQRAETTGFYLAQLIRRLPVEERICMAGHSHGALAVASALQLLGGGVVAGRVLRNSEDSSLRGIRAVFLAGTLDRGSLAPGREYDRILRTSESVLNVRNSRDSTLAFYPLRKPFSESALGKVGLKTKDWQRIGYAHRLKQIDVATMLGHEHDWMTYFADTRIARMMSTQMMFE